MLSFLSAPLLVASTIVVATSSQGVLAASNSTVGPFGLDNIKCTQAFYSIQANSTNVKFVGIDQTSPNQTVQTALVTLFTTAPENFTALHTNGTFQHSATYNISGTLCTPIKGAKADSAIQLLVHGIGFDSSYWDFSFEPTYSYVRHAGSHGYTTFRYDRLGTGLSETPTNGFDESQAPTEVAILTSINKLLRGTTLVGGKEWSKVVGIGHSYGSVQTEAVSASNPDLYDAVILQGFSANATFLPNYLQAAAYSIARDTLPQLANKPPVWLVTATPATNQIPFWYFPFYANGAFDLARQGEQAVTLGSEFTIGNVAGPSNFTKPVQFVIGDHDFIFCGGNCFAGPNGQTIPAASAAVLYPNAPSEIYIAANTGHAANQHFSAPAIYEAMLSFVSSHGL